MSNKRGLSVADLFLPVGGVDRTRRQEICHGDTSYHEVHRQTREKVTMQVVVEYAHS